MEVSIHMQEIMQSQTRERICINVDKVFDWIVKELSFEFTKDKIHFPGLHHEHHEHHEHKFRNAVVTCNVVPDPHFPVVVLHREDRQFMVDGRTVTLQQVTLKKKFLVTVCVTLENGTVLRSDEIHVSRNEQVILCAPRGTEIEVTYTNLDCFVASTGEIHRHDDKLSFSDLRIVVSVCQSIQSTFPVTVEFLAEYCEPRDEIAFACGAPVRPRNCTGVFPSHS